VDAFHHYEAGVRHLRRVDPVMRRVIERIGPCKPEWVGRRDRFATLTSAILHQQLALAAAQTITRRFLALYSRDGRPAAARWPRPEELLATDARRLRSAGVSRQKIAYLRDLAARAADGRLRFARFARMPDEAVIANLTEVKGIGQWTAEMFLMVIGRPDVLAVGDLGLQHGFRQVYGLRKLPSADKMRRLAEPWRPYRTVGCWYIWAARRMRDVL
jgi:DNA-3-methyladenine glycosylase II